MYAVFEAKQDISAAHVDYAHRKIASVRRLYRTSLPVPHAGGVHDPREPIHIVGGILTLDSGWRMAFGDPISRALAAADDDGRIDIGCVAAHGHFVRTVDGEYAFTREGRPAAAFLFELIAQLQALATVPMIDIRRYAEWLAR